MKLNFIERDKAVPIIDGHTYAISSSSLNECERMPTVTARFDGDRLAMDRMGDNCNVFASEVTGTTYHYQGDGRRHAGKFTIWWRDGDFWISPA